MIPVPVRISRPFYPTIFYLIFFAFPFLWAVVDTRLRTSDWVIASLESLALVASFVFIQWRCSSWAMGYWTAIGARCVALESGCINATLIYIFPILLIFHIQFFVIAVISLFRGRAYAQVATLNFVRPLLVKDTGIGGKPCYVPSRISQLCGRTVGRYGTDPRRPCSNRCWHARSLRDRRT
jgi:hypothetical protein